MAFTFGISAATTGGPRARYATHKRKIGLERDGREGREGTSARGSGADSNEEVRGEARLIAEHSRGLACAVFAPRHANPGQKKPRRAAIHHRLSVG